MCFCVITKPSTDSKGYDSSQDVYIHEVHCSSLYVLDISSWANTRQVTAYFPVGVSSGLYQITFLCFPEVVGSQLLFYVAWKKYIIATMNGFITQQFYRRVCTRAAELFPHLCFEDVEAVKH